MQQVFSIKLSPFQRYRLLAIPLLALILLHFIFYQKLPFQEDYHFPWFDFLLLITMGLMICQCNYIAYKKLQGRRAAGAKFERRWIFYHYGFGWLVTWLIFSLLYWLQLWAFQASFDLMRYWGFTTLLLAISSLETSVLLLRDLYGFLQEKKPPGKGLPILEKDEANYGLINVPAGKQILRLPIEDLAYLFSSGGIVSLYTFSGRRITTSFSSLDELEPLLAHAPFFRLNRQYLANRRAVEKISDGKNRKLIVRIGLANGAAESLGISVSRYKAKAFREWFATGETIGQPSA